MNEQFPKDPIDLVTYLEGRISKMDAAGFPDAEETLHQMIVDCKEWEAEDLIKAGSTEEQLGYVFNLLNRREFLIRLERHFVDACGVFQYRRKPPEGWDKYGLPLDVWEEAPLSEFVEAVQVQPEWTPLIRNMIQAYRTTPDPEAPFWGLSAKETFLKAPNGRLALIGSDECDSQYILVIVESP